MSSPAGRDQMSDAESEIKLWHERHHDGTCAECEELWPCSAIVLAEQNGLLRAERDILRSMIYRQSEEAREHLNRTWSGDVRRASPVDQGNQVIREQSDMSLERSEVTIRKQRSEWDERPATPRNSRAVGDEQSAANHPKISDSSGSEFSGNPG